MKKTTFLWAMAFLFGATLFAQTTAELTEIRAQAATQSESINVQELLTRASNVNTDALSAAGLFTKSELEVLRSYHQSQNRNVLADIIPTAGATETFAVVTGDRFFDPGGPGGSSTGGTPGNYPNCGCVTLTTLTGVTDINFDFFSVFATFDWLRIYDGVDTTGAILYDNSATGAQSGDITTADMAASTGTAFTSTTGSLTFEFNATAVVDYGGWDVEINPGGGGGGGGGVTVFPTLIDFENACIGSNNQTMEDFQGALIAPNSVQACGVLISSAGDGVCYNPGEIENDVEITSSGPAPDDLTVTAGEGFFGINPNDVIAGANTFTAFTIVEFTGTEPVTSAGFEIYNFFGGSDTQVRLFDAGGVLIDSFAIPFGQGFVAFISDVPVSRMEIEADAGDGELMSNLFFGSCVSNDECSGAIAMECGDTETGDTNDYTDTGGANASPDAWYSYTGSGAAELVTFSLCDGATSYDSLLTVFDSCGGTVVVGNDDSCGLQSEVSFLSDGTTTYYVAVEGFATSAGAFSLTLSCNPLAANDLCDDAIAITCDETVLGSTEFATPDQGAPDCGLGNNSPGVWYVIDDATGLPTDYVVSLCDGGTTYDSKLVIFSGDDCGTLVCVAENDDSCGLQSEVSFTSDGTSTYYVLVNGFGSGSSGDFSLNLSCVPVPPFNDDISNSIDVDEAGLPYTDPAVPMPAATTEAGGTPVNCDNAGVLGVWYNFVATNSGTATATVVTPAGYTSVTFYTAPDEDSDETDLTLVDWFDNQCVPGVTTTIPVEAGQAYYVYVANHEAITDIVIDGDFLLGVGDAIVDGFTYFPNPANNELNLDAGIRSIDSATIYNILGQAVVDQNVGASSTRLDVANLSVGTYIMKVVVEGEVGIYKIVKQ